MLTPGQIISSRYRVLRLLGQGGMGGVYLAEDTRLTGLMVSLKLSSDPTPVSTQQFQHEAVLLANLQHPSLPRVTDYFSTPDGHRFLVMEYVEGHDLQQLVWQNGALPETIALAQVRPIFDAVKYLHANHVIHRDIKPANIIITRQGKAMLVDFGIARTLLTGQLTRTGARGMGSPGYAPPEQYSGGTREQSDVYALGATLYFMLTGQDPIESTHRAAGTDLIPPRRFNPNITPRTETAILTAMNLPMNQRFVSVEQLAQALGESGSTSVLPSLGHIILKTSGLTIPLVSTIEEVKSEIFLNTRGARIQNIVNTILTKQQTTRSHTFMLYGIRGFGGTTIAESIRDKVIEARGANLVALLILPEQAPTDNWAETIKEILRGLRQGAGNINQKLQKSVEKYHREYVKSGSLLATERGEQAEIEFSLPNIPLPVSSINIGDIRISKSRTEKPQSDVLDDRQRAQILLDALRDLIDYLIMENARVVLIIDKVSDIKILEPLKRLTVLPNVFTVTVVDKQSLDRWQSDSTCTDLLNHFGKTTEYFSCVWEMPRDLCRRLTKGVPQADNNFFERFIHYIQFKGHGLPDATIKAINPFYTNAQELRPTTWSQRLFQRAPDNKPFLQVTDKEDIQMIFAGAEINDLLNNHWEELLQNPKDNTRVLGKEEVEFVKTTQYRIANLLFQEGLLGKRVSYSNLLKYAATQIGLNDAQAWVVEKLVELLERESICETDSENTISLSKFLARSRS